MWDMPTSVSCSPVGYLIKHSRICGICPDLHVLRQWRLRDEDFRSAPTAIIRSNIVAEGVRQSTLGHLSEFMQLGWLIVRVKAFNNLNEIRHSWTPFEFEIFGIYPAFLDCSELPVNHLSPVRFMAGATSL